MPILFGRSGERSQKGSRRIIHEDIDSVEAVGGALHGGGDVESFRNVTAIDENPVRWKSGGGSLQLALAAAVENDGGAFFKEPFGRCRANSGSCSRNDDDLPATLFMFFFTTILSTTIRVVV
jgi:hypothetical protein